jgi:hypothetical protein
MVILELTEDRHDDYEPVTVTEFPVDDGAQR